MSLIIQNRVKTFFFSLLPLGSCIKASSCRNVVFLVIVMELSGSDLFLSYHSLLFYYLPSFFFLLCLPLKKKKKKALGK